MITYLKHPRLKTLGTVAAVTLLLSACDSDNTLITEPPTPPPPAMAKFEVTVSNITHDQPFSPIAIISHNDQYRAFTIGEAASSGLELLAEDGNNSDFLQEAVDSSNSSAQASGAGIVGPGANETIEIELLASDVDQLSVITMLVNTNDAITGRASIDISQLANGDSMALRGVVYDAGTERNTEAIGTIPGPADGGEGFNAARDDIADQVTMHPGVISADDGLTNSALSQAHRFDNTSIAIRITRTE